MSIFTRSKMRRALDKNSSNISPALVATKLRRDFIRYTRTDPFTRALNVKDKTRLDKNSLKALSSRLSYTTKLRRDEVKAWTCILPYHVYKQFASSLVASYFLSNKQPNCFRLLKRITTTNTWCQHTERKNGRHSVLRLSCAMSMICQSFFYVFNQFTTMHYKTHISSVQFS